MSNMTMLWASIALVTLGFTLIWLGTFVEQALMWIGLVAFLVGMFMGPATRLLDKNEEKRET